MPDEPGDAVEVTRRAMVAIAVAAVAGCETAPVSTSTSRDSLGVTIVESAAPLWTVGAGWWIEEEPVVDLAETGSGDMHLFYRVGDVLRTPAGDLAVADRGSQQIRIYEASGHYLRAFGGPGDGPGEFRSLWSVVLTHDGTLLGLDYRAGGPGAEFDIESGLVGTFSLPG